MPFTFTYLASSHPPTYPAPPHRHTEGTMLKRLVCQAGRAATVARASGVPTSSSSAAAAAVSTTIINAGAQHMGESVAWGGQQRRSMMMMSTRGGGRFSASALPA